MERYRLLALWVVTILLRAPAQAQPGTVKDIVPGVWFREGEQDIAQSNNIIIEMKDYLVVVDANYPDGARRVIEAAKKLSSKPIKYVIDSHADPKCVLPGHGVPGGKEVLEGQIRFFEALYAAVQGAIKQGKTLDQIVTLENGTPVATSIELSKDLMDKYVFHGPNLKPWQATRF